MNQYDSLYYATSNPQARLPGPGDFASLGPPPVPGFSQAPAEYHQVLPNFSQPTYDQIYGRYSYYPPYNSTAATMGFYSTEVTPAAFQPAPTASKLTRGDAQQQQQQQQYVGASDTGNVETTPLLPKELLSNGSNERPVKQELESDHKNVVPVEILRNAIEYIESLEEMLQGAGKLAKAGGGVVGATTVPTPTSVNPGSQDYMVSNGSPYYHEKMVQFSDGQYNSSTYEQTNTTNQSAANVSSLDCLSLIVNSLTPKPGMMDGSDSTLENQSDNDGDSDGDDCHSAAGQHSPSD